MLAVVKRNGEDSYYYREIQIEEMNNIDGKLSIEFKLFVDKEIIGKFYHTDVKWNKKGTTLEISNPVKITWR